MMIKVDNVHKHFGKTQALAGVSFTVNPGTIFGLLGPNGAGKTTITHILAGIETADQGRVSISGLDIREHTMAARAKIGLVPQEPGFYGALSARENLAFWAAMYGVPSGHARESIDELLHLTGLSQRADEPVSRFSGGMRRRLNLAVGLVHHPPVILLDEPTLEVDPQSRRQIVDFVRNQAKNGATVLYTTHQLGDAQEVCDHLAIVDQGRIVAAGTLEELRKLLPHASSLRFEFAFDIDGDLASQLKSLPGAGTVSVAGGIATIEIAEARVLMSAVADILHIPGLIGMRFEEASLETVFLHLTGRGLRD